MLEMSSLVLGYSFTLTACAMSGQKPGYKGIWISTWLTFTRQSISTVSR